MKSQGLIGADTYSLSRSRAPSFSSMARGKAKQRPAATAPLQNGKKSPPGRGTLGPPPAGQTSLDLRDSRPAGRQKGRGMGRPGHRGLDIHIVLEE